MIQKDAPISNLVWNVIEIRLERLRIMQIEFCGPQTLSYERFAKRADLLGAVMALVTLRSGSCVTT